MDFTKGKATMETLYIIIFVQELCKVLMTYMGILGISYRLKTKGTAILAAAVTTAVIGVVYFLGKDYTTMTRYFVLIIYIISIISFFDTIFKKLLMFIPAYCGICVLDMAVFGILKMLTDYTDSYVDKINEVMISNFISLIFIFSISLILNKLGKEHHKFTWKNYLFASLTIVISAFFIAYSNFVLLRIDSNVNTVMNVIFCIVWILLMLIVFIYLNAAWKKETYRLQLENSRQLMQQQQKYYEMLLNKDEDMRRFRHDYQSHLSIVHNYISEEKYDYALRYLDGIIENAEKLRTYKTGNRLIDIILNDIVDKYKEMGIMIELKGRFVEREKISEYDICTIFYNAIENAFEAAQKVQEGSRFVSISISENDSNKWLVLIKNSTLQQVIINNNHIETTKENKLHHGMGITNIRQCVTKNGGMLQLSWKDNVFTTRIIL